MTDTEVNNKLRALTYRVNDLYFMSMCWWLVMLFCVVFLAIRLEKLEDKVKKPVIELKK